MGITIKSRKMLWGRSACRCNFPGCRRELFMDATLTDDESLIGEECHIVARSKDGPRGISDLTAEQRDKYNNLVLMCNAHHKVIDDQPGEYTINVLHEMKDKHEAWVKETLDYDEIKLRDEEVYSMYIDRWIELSKVYDWNAWTSFMLSSGQPHLYKDMAKSLDTLRKWLLNRVWPHRYPELEDSFDNFRAVLEDLYILFHYDLVDYDAELLYVRKFYKIDEWNQERYSRLSREYRFHVYLIEDLVLELTRAGNLVCDMIRRYLLQGFMIEEGRLMITYGPVQGLTYVTNKVEYKSNERSPHPYPGLEKFKDVRDTRDMNFSAGVSCDDNRFT